MQNTDYSRRCLRSTADSAAKNDPTKLYQHRQMTNLLYLSPGRKNSFSHFCPRCLDMVSFYPRCRILATSLDSCHGQMMTIDIWGQAARLGWTRLKLANRKDFTILSEIQEYRFPRHISYFAQCTTLCLRRAREYMKTHPHPTALSRIAEPNHDSLLKQAES